MHIHVIVIKTLSTRIGLNDKNKKQFIITFTYNLLNQK